MSYRNSYRNEVLIGKKENRINRPPNTSVRRGKAPNRRK